MREGPTLGPRTLHNPPGWVMAQISQDGPGPQCSSRSKAGDTDSPSATEQPGCLSGLTNVGVCPSQPHVGPPHLRASLCSPVAHGKKGTTITLGHGTSPSGPRLAEWLLLPLLSHPKRHQAHSHPQLPGKRQCPRTAGATAGLGAQGTKLPSPGLLAAEGLAASASTARCLPGTASPGT